VNAFPNKPCGVNLPRATAEGFPARENSACANGAEPPHEPAEFGAEAAAKTTPLAPETPRDPAWSGFDILRLVFLGIVALFIGVFTVLFIAHFWFYRRLPIGALARSPLVVVAGQALAYILLLAYMYVLVTRERRRPDFLAAIHWNWPDYWSLYMLGGFTLSVVLGLLVNRLPIPKNLPIDTFFRTSAEAWSISVFGITLAPLMEELFFRGFLYPVLARRIRVMPAVAITAFAFALLHGSQLSFSWGPVLVIFLVGVVLTLVRAHRNSVAASLLIHMAYNATISLAMCVKTDGFRHLEKLNS